MSDAQQPLGFIVTLATQHFDFEAHGRTEEDANEAMGRALNLHASQYGLVADWWELFADDFQTRAFISGAGYRDGEVLTCPL